jgi:subtilisin
MGGAVTVEGPSAGKILDEDSQVTGRQLVSFRTFDSDVVRRLSRTAGIKAVATSSDYRETAIDGTLPDGAELFIFESINAGILIAEDDLRHSLSASADKVQLSEMEPERFIYAASAPTEQYLAGFKDGVDYAIRAVGGSAHAPDWMLDDLNFDPHMLHTDPTLTWSLGYMGICESSSLGDNVAVAILDSGIDSDHPDFTGRQIDIASFVSQQRSGDPYGHGTHCAGILAGPLNPSGCARYGVAPKVDLCVGKVLNDDGRGVEGNLLAGINWAADNNVRVVSMSVSTRPTSDEKYSRIFERTARALAEQENSTLLVAAAGNDSDRRGNHVATLGRPASSPSVIAVGAIDQALRVANFSNGSGGLALGQIDIAAPGVNILSAWPGSDGPRATMDGTSMATPHVAGALAHLIERHPRATARQLIGELHKDAKRLAARCADVGAGLVQVPA